MIFATHTIKQGDTLPRLAFTLKGADGAVQDLTGATVRFSMRPYNGGALTVDHAACTVLGDPSLGQGAYEWDVLDTAVAGKFKGELEVTFADSSKETWPNNSDIIVNILPQVA